MHAPPRRDIVPEEVQIRAHGLDDLMQRIDQYFGRREARERTNAWQLAEMAGDRTPYGVQNLLGRSRWDADKVRDELRAHVTEHLGDPHGILVVDETCFPKKGQSQQG